MPDYWPRWALYVHEHADEWGWNPELLYNTTKFLVEKIKEHYTNAGDTDAINLIEMIGEDLILSHLKVNG